MLDQINKHSNLNLKINERNRNCEWRWFVLYFLIVIFSEKDLLAFLVAFFACLTLGMEMGLVIGASVDIAFLLFSNARPKVRVDTISVQNLNFTFEYVLSKLPHWIAECLRPGIHFGHADARSLVPRRRLCENKNSNFTGGVWRERADGETSSCYWLQEHSETRLYSSGGKLYYSFVHLQ